MRVIGSARAAFVLLCAVPLAAAAAEPTGEAVYRTRCASCHEEPGTTKAPSLEAMRAMTADRVAFALTNGIMKSQAAGLSFPEMRALIDYASAGSQPDWVPPESAWCANRAVSVGEPVVASWGFDERSTRALGAEITVIDASNVEKLTLQWAFGLPGATETRSQPVVTSDTLFVGASSGHVFALDRLTGCIRWHRATPVRTSLLLGRMPGQNGSRATLYFGDMQGFVTALDAANGEIVWRERAGLFEASVLTGALVQHGETLYVPISSIEVGLAANPEHECCKTHGAVRALHAATGDVRWTHRMAPEAKPTSPSPAGVMRWAPSGAPVWATPTVDAKRGVLYVGTGENYSSPTTDRSDAIVALDLETGEERWAFQATTGDAYNLACDRFSPGPNCPKENGPDFDFGAAVVIAQDSRGRDILLAGQKSGEVWALDPDAKGKVVWRRRVGSGSKLGGVHWGLAVADGRVFVSIADPQYPIPGYKPKPGLYALSIDDGSVVWERRIERGCHSDIQSYFRRTEQYPDCSFWFGLSAAPTALPGVLIAGALDGKLRAFAARDGAELWTFATVRPFETVNGVPAHGGSIDAAGAVAIGKHLYVQSGYRLFGQLPGNVLLAFSLP